MKLKCDVLLSTSAFKFNLRRYNTVNGICDHPDIKTVSFVGSDVAGRHIYSRASAAGKRVQCNMGRDRVYSLTHLLNHVVLACSRQENAPRVVRACPIHDGGGLAEDCAVILLTAPTVYRALSRKHGECFPVALTTTLFINHPPTHSPTLPPTHSAAALHMGARFRILGFMF